MNACVVLERGLLSPEHRWKSPRRGTRELAGWGLVSRLVDHVEDIESREPDTGAIGSRVGESFLECSVLTPEKRACRLAEQGLISRFPGSLDVRKSLGSRMYFY